MLKSNSYETVKLADIKQIGLCINYTPRYTVTNSGDALIWGILKDHRLKHSEQYVFLSRLSSCGSLSEVILRLIDDQYEMTNLQYYTSSHYNIWWVTKIQ